jgi:hypothetical protein
MSDEKQTKEVKDEELDKVSGGTGEHSMGTGAHPEDHIKPENAGGKHNVFSTGTTKTK